MGGKYKINIVEGIDQINKDPFLTQQSIQDPSLTNLEYMHKLVVPSLESGLTKRWSERMEKKQAEGTVFNYLVVYTKDENNQPVSMLSGLASYEKDGLTFKISNIATIPGREKENHMTHLVLDLIDQLRQRDYKCITSFNDLHVAKMDKAIKDDLPGIEKKSFEIGDSIIKSKYSPEWQGSYEEAPKYSAAMLDRLGIHFPKGAQKMIDANRKYHEQMTHPNLSPELREVLRYTYPAQPLPKGESFMNHMVHLANKTNTPGVRFGINISDPKYNDVSRELRYQITPETLNQIDKTRRFLPNNKETNAGRGGRI